MGRICNPNRHIFGGRPQFKGQRASQRCQIHLVFWSRSWWIQQLKLYFNCFRFWNRQSKLRFSVSDHFHRKWTSIEFVSCTPVESIKYTRSGNIDIDIQTNKTHTGCSTSSANRFQMFANWKTTCSGCGENYTISVKFHRLCGACWAAKQIVIFIISALSFALLWVCLVSGCLFAFWSEHLHLQSSPCKSPFSNGQRPVVFQFSYSNLSEKRDSSWKRPWHYEPTNKSFASKHSCMTSHKNFSSFCAPVCLCFIFQPGVVEKRFHEWSFYIITRNLRKTG